MKNGVGFCKGVRCDNASVGFSSLSCKPPAQQQNSFFGDLQGR